MEELFVFFVGNGSWSWEVGVGRLELGGWSWEVGVGRSDCGGFRKMNGWRFLLDLWRFSLVSY